MTRPNFFLIGAAKAGTTSMQRLLDEHPQVFMCGRKEPEFFSQPPRDRLLLYTDSYYTYPNDLTQYLQLFRNAGDAAIVGEASTGYSQRPRLASAAERIFDFNPESRILYVVRDPVERAISHYWTAVRCGANERRDLTTALLADDYYRSVSDYALQIEPYLRLFGPERVKILTFEEFQRAPVPTMQAVYRWLGVDPSFTPHAEVFNPTPATICLSRGPQLLQTVRNSRAWNCLAPWVPPGARSALRRLAEVELRTTEVPAPLVNALRERLAEPVRRFEVLMARRLAEWSTYYAAATCRKPEAPNVSHA